MRIMVTGAGGMLGTEVVRAIGEESEHTAVSLTRMNMDIGNDSRVYAALERFAPDAVINCAGLTPQRPGVTAREMIYSNAFGPHVLAEECELRKIRLVHVSTDCVFSGGAMEDYRYLEGIGPDPIDLYGWTKAAGEPENKNTLNVRCSFVWPTGGLVGWLTKQGGVAPGWNRAQWSGLSARAYARVLVELAPMGLTGALHVPGEVITKWRLLVSASAAFGLDLEVRPINQPVVNRALASWRWEKEVGIEVPTWADMLKEMAEFYNG